MHMRAQNCPRMPMVLNSEAEIVDFLKLPWDTLGLGRFATDSRVCKRSSDSDPWTGTFHQTLDTADLFLQMPPV